MANLAPPRSMNCESYKLLTAVYYARRRNVCLSPTVRHAFYYSLPPFFIPHGHSHRYRQSRRVRKRKRVQKRGGERRRKRWGGGITPKHARSEETQRRHGNWVCACAKIIISWLSYVVWIAEKSFCLWQNQGGWSRGNERGEFGLWSDTKSAP